MSPNRINAYRNQRDKLVRMADASGCQDFVTFEVPKLLDALEEAERNRAMQNSRLTRAKAKMARKE